jgi:hypothetical protein
MNIEEYIEVRKAIPLEKVSCGYRTVTLFSAAELAEGQVGYSVGEAGEDFTGESEGDWRANWLVIGDEDVCGDPIFVDLSESDLPVFTAAHGQGRWDPEILASSFAGFVKALAEVDRVSQTRRNSVQLERHPLSKVEREQVLKQIAKVNGKANLEFWDGWFEV